ncbi:MAG: hypothetical protein E6G02_11285 [Actinobacteria bacterium]|nr:MAG: hypothetical protein E6G02_11285 [Actinomycetota bacterium]
MKRQRLILVAAAAGLTAAALTLGGVLHDSSSASPTAAAQVAPTSASGQPSPGNTLAVAARLQATLRGNPNDVPSLDSLGLAYQQRARETGDPTYYTKSDEALHRALALVPRDLLATSGLGSLALSRHRFREALVLGRPLATTASSAMRSSSSAATTPPSRLSTPWRASSRAFPRMPGSPTRASCSATFPGRSAR